MATVQVEHLARIIFGEKLINSEKRIISTQKRTKIRLDRNESAYDISTPLKKEVLHKVETDSWKNYPTPYYRELEALIAGYCGVNPGQIVPGAGSASLISSVLNYFAINQKQIVIAYPSFSLYEYHCNSYGITYEKWKLNEELEYDIDKLPCLKPGGLVLFASPNNPVGNCLSKENLGWLLKKYPENLFLMDEVYSEFCAVSMLDLMEKYPNLILLRSFSKTFSAAGLRMGYLIANERLAVNFRKLILPFSLNIFTEAFVKTVLTNPNELHRNKGNIAGTIAERDRLFFELNKSGKSKKKYKAYPSSANFLLVQFYNKKDFELLNSKIKAESIKLLDLSDIPALGNSLRITIGTQEENDVLISLFKTL